jgi:hypothetical protein
MKCFVKLQMIITIVFVVLIITNANRLNYINAFAMLSMESIIKNVRTPRNMTSANVENSIVKLNIDVYVHWGTNHWGNKKSVYRRNVFALVKH